MTHFQQIIQRRPVKKFKNNNKQASEQNIIYHNQSHEQYSQFSYLQPNYQCKIKASSSQNNTKQYNYNNRQVSFASNLFISPNSSDNNQQNKFSPEKDFSINQTIKMYDNFANMFVTFANNYDQQDQLPYFQQIQQQSKNKDIQKQDKNQYKQVGSYQSNFINDFNYNQDSIQQNCQKNRKNSHINEKTNNDVSKVETSLIAVKQRSPSFYKGKTMQADGVLRVTKNKFQKVTYKITQLSIIIQDVPLQIKQILKIKIFPIEQSQPKYQMIKINTKGIGEQLFLGMKKFSKYGEFPLPYYTFAKIVIKKLKYFGIYNITEWKGPQKSPHQYYMMKKLKISRREQDIVRKDTNKSIKEQETSKRDTSKKKRRSISKSQSERFKTKSTYKQKFRQIYCKANTYIHGKIYKKSKYWGQWQKRHVQINQTGIFSYRNQQDQNASIQIYSKSIKYVWTWFSILMQQKVNKKEQKSICQQKQQIEAVQYEERNVLKRMMQGIKNQNINYLIIKIKHGFNQQSQFGIPISNFDTDSYSKNWLFAFFRILPSFQNKN